MHNHNWFAVADEVRSHGGLFFGGPKHCPWHRIVLVSLAGVFCGDRMQECDNVDHQWNMTALSSGLPPDDPPPPLVSSGDCPGLGLVRGLHRALGDDISDDDRWLVDAVEARSLSCENIVNGMSDRLKQHLPRRCVSFPSR